MVVLAQGVGLVTVIIIAAVLARWLGALAPIVLVVIGLALSYIPDLPDIRLDPPIVLVGILPPLIYVAAKEVSVSDFRFDLRPIMLLALGLVLFTAVAVALMVHAIVPEAPFAACLALGAVVAPPDAVSATAVAERIGLPRRVVNLLEGESLVNDASALVLFRLAVTAATGASVGAGQITRDTLVAVGGGVVIGAAGALIVGSIHRRIHDPLIDNALSLLTPFAIALAAEALGASAVVAVLITGMALGSRLPALMTAASRMQMEFFWRIAGFLLEGTVFVLVGLQLRGILSGLHQPPTTVVGVTAAVLGTVIFTRFAWVFPGTYLPSLIRRLSPRSTHKLLLGSWASPTRVPVSYPTVVAWAGMRGVVTLAAALALPLTLHGRAYPRALFVWIAFAVIVVTLLLQGLTLPALVRWLRLPPDDQVAEAAAEAQVQQRASLAARDQLEADVGGAPQDVVDQLRDLIERRSNRAWERLGGSQRETPTQAYVRLRRVMLETERQVFRDARARGQIPDRVLRRAERDMDLEEAMLKGSSRRVGEGA